MSLVNVFNKIEDSSTLNFIIFWLATIFGTENGFTNTEIINLQETF
jgi:hypothetical protein